jgi:hypothetical protein
MARNGDRCDLSAVAVFMLCDNGIGCIWAPGGSLQVSTRTLRRLSAPIRSAGSDTDQMCRALINAYC